MLGNPFADPFGIGGGPSMPDVFRRRGGGGRAPRKAEAAPEPEAEPMAQEAAAEEEPKSDKVVLKNPRWEVEKVGFNEETDISVEAVLPESQAHKTRVEFELFAKTPEGAESISKGEGHIKEGKAQARVPVYMPQYRDEEGNLLAAVDYFFSAGHSAANHLKDETLVKRVEEMANLLIESHILEEGIFVSGQSQVQPGGASRLKALAERIAQWKENHPDGKLAVFGHVDAEGRPEPNKRLTERRARCIHAFLMKDAATWDSLAQEEKWDRTSIPDFRAFLAENNSLSLSGKDFDVIDGKAYAGCSEYNQVEAKAGPHAPNRRVAVFLLKSNKNFPIQYPCKHGDIVPCKAQAGRKGGRRTAGFSCLFYDKLITESVGGSQGSATLKAAAVEIEDVHFGHDGALPFLSPPESEGADPFTALNAYAEALVHLSRNPGLAFKIFGHADTSGSAEHNLELSRRRAVAVKALLDGEEGPFVKVAGAEKGNEALSHYLDCFQSAFGWPLEPAEGDEPDSSRIRAFQESINAEHEGNLKVDGKIGPKTWGAVFHLLKEQIGLLVEAKGVDLSTVRVQYVSEGGGIEACGEKHPLEVAERDGFRSQKNRRVEIAFLPKDRPAPKGRKHIVLEPIVITADKPKPKPASGVLTGIEAAIERKDGKRVAPQGVDLEVVADPVMGDVILLTPEGEGKVQTRWEITGWSEEKHSGTGTWKTKVRGFKRPSEQFWIPHFNPHVVAIKAAGSDGREVAKHIKVYPGDRVSITVGGNWLEKFDKVMAYFQKYTGPKVKLDLLHGSGTGSAGFREAKSGPEVFWSWEYEGAFSPLIGGEFRVEVPVVTFMSFIPASVRKYAADLVGFVAIQGGVNLNWTYARKDIKHSLEKMKMDGGVTVRAGIEATLAKDKVLKANVVGTTGFSVHKPDYYNDDQGIGFKVTLEFPGIMVKGAFELFDGWIVMEASAVLMEKKEFEPFRLGTDSFK